MLNLLQKSVASGIATDAKYIGEKIKQAGERIDKTISDLGKKESGPTIKKAFKHLIIILPTRPLPLHLLVLTKIGLKNNKRKKMKRLYNIKKK